MINPSDAELVEHAVHGDAAAFCQLVRRHERSIYGLIYAAVHHAATAQDLTQETFIRAYLSLPLLRDREKFSAWIRRLAACAAADWRRARCHSVASVDDLDDLADARQPDVLSQCVESELQAIILLAVNKLPYQYRLPLVLLHLSQMSIAEIAEFLAIPAGTVKSLISRGRGQIRQTLELSAKASAEMVDKAMDQMQLPDDFSARIAALIEAIKADDISRVARLVREDVNLASAKIEPHAPTPLHLAAAENRVDIAEALIAAGVDVNARADWGGTALDSALIYAQDPVAQTIARHVDGALPLRVVAGLGWVERVKKLLATEPRPGQEELDGALHRAAMNGRIDAAGLLLNAGADIQARGFMGTSPLHQAARTGQLAMVEFLISRGADLHARDDQYRGTPADWAKEYQHPAVEALLRKHATPE